METDRELPAEFVDNRIEGRPAGRVVYKSPEGAMKGHRERRSHQSHRVSPKVSSGGSFPAAADVGLAGSDRHPGVGTPAGSADPHAANLLDSPVLDILLS